jgi:alanine dehydrogenase
MEQPAYIPQEERLMVASKQQSLRIGLPLESTWAENRVALTPEGVHLLVQHGHEILVESGAGLAARYTDLEYTEAGAQVTSDKKAVFQCPILVKVEAPSEKEWPLMVQNQVVFFCFAAQYGLGGLSQGPASQKVYGTELWPVAR